MAVETISTNVYTCDYCGNQTTQAPTGWFQVWVINVMEPKHFDTARCALAMLQAANVAPEINIVVEDATPVEPATPDIPAEPATPDTPIEPATPETPVEPMPEPTPPIDPSDINPDSDPTEDAEPPLDPDEPQPA